MRKLYKAFNPKLYKWLYNIYKQYGSEALREHLISTIFGFTRYYNDWMVKHYPTKEELEKQKRTKFEYSPKISIVVPTYNTPMNFLEDMINSVINQTYDNWELCIADGSTSNEVVARLEKFCSKENRIRYIKLKDNEGISLNTNAAIEIANGEYISFMDHDDIIHENALYEVVKCLQDVHHDLIYTDEDFVSNDLRVYHNPVFKPDWSPDLLLSHNYITHFVTVKKNIINKVGMLRSQYDGAQDYDFLLRVTKICNSIYHIPKVLYHWRENETSVAGNSDNKKYAFEAGKKALQNYLDNNKIAGTVKHTEYPGYYTINYQAPDNSLVSVIIPNMNHKEDLDKCIESLYNVNNYKNFEIIIIENNSNDEEIFEYYKFLKNKYSNLKVVTYEGEFNFSAINNFGVKYANGEYLLFLNNDTEMIKPDSLVQMIGNCTREDVAIVGPKLLFEDRTIQHVGVALGFGGFAGHVFSGIKENSRGYMLRPQINCNYSAVTGACLLIKSKLFKEIKGFNEDFKVGLNDIDLCLRARHLGKYIVYNANTLWFHYESKSRGYDTTKEKQERLDSEIKLFQSIWKDDLEKSDPFYSPNFSTDFIPYQRLS